MGRAVDELELRLAPLNISQGQRDSAKKKGLALPDGSYPVDTPDKLSRAIQAWGRCPPEHRAALKRLLLKAARVHGSGQDVLDRIRGLKA